MHVPCLLQLLYLVFCHPHLLFNHLFECINEGARENAPSRLDDILQFCLLWDSIEPDLLATVFLMGHFPTLFPW